MSRQIWDNFWQKHSQQHNFNGNLLDYRAPEPELEALLKHYPSTNKVALDVGCGDGRNATLCSKLEFQTTGIDLSPIAIAHAKLRQLPNAEFLVGPMTDLPFASSQFDLSICWQTIFHARVADMKRALSELQRVTKPGGLLILTLISAEGNHYRLGEEVEPNTFRTTDGDDAGELHHFYTEQEARDFVSDCQLLHWYYHPIDRHWTIMLANKT